MKIVILYAGALGYDMNLNAATGICKEVFDELEVETETINLSIMNLPYFDNMVCDSMMYIVNSIKDAGGVVFASTAEAFLPCGYMVNLLEHFNCSEYNRVLLNKYCFIITSSYKGGEYRAAEHISDSLGYNGAYECGRLCLSLSQLNPMQDSVREITEKYAEDFFRSIRSSKKFLVKNITAPQQETASIKTSQAIKTKQTTDSPFMQDELFEPKEFKAFDDNNNLVNEQQELDDSFYTDLLLENDMRFDEETEANDNTKTEANSQTQVLNSSNSSQASNSSPTLSIEEEASVNDISELFSKKYIQEINRRNASKQQAQIIKKNPAHLINSLSSPHSSYAGHDIVELTPKAKTCRSLTESIGGSFKPSMAQGLNLTVQLSITGDRDNFDGYFTVLNTDFQYTTGKTTQPDITIMAEEKAWLSILRGRFTIQKGFLTGQIKVRGNLFQLPKLDQIFSFNE